jgi:hypothetical protein
MHTSIRNIATILVVLVFGISSCKQKDDPTPPVPTEETGTVKLEFSNKVGSEALVLNTAWYTNQNGDSFNVTKFNYFITNVKLNKSGGSWAETESYHLLKQTVPSSLEFDMTGIPNGTYTSLTFTIGVDSTRNVSGAQTGALDQANDMFWDWNTGYIMVKFEGTSPKSNQPGNILQFHMGGFSGANSVLRTVTLNLPSDLVVNGNTTHIHLKADVLELFKNPNTINFATTSAVHMAGAGAKMFADNYNDMISVTLVGN